MLTSGKLGEEKRAQASQRNAQVLQVGHSLAETARADDSDALSRPVLFKSSDHGFLSVEAGDQGRKSGQLPAKEI